jgi:RNA polymerase sigma-70 factor (ECF subfamily)
MAGEGGPSMDAESIKRLQAGDAEAFARLVAEHQNRVLNACYRFVFNKEDAEDVAQEVFIEVHRSIGSFRQESTLSTWIYRIVVSKSLDFIRKKNRKKRFIQMQSLFAGKHGSGETGAIETRDPARILEQSERLRIIEQAIGCLPKKQGVAFTLSKCEGFGNREIADVMGLSLSAVDALLHRAKGRLQKQLAAYFCKELRQRR